VITAGERSRRLALFAGALAACALAGTGCKKPAIGGAVESAQGVAGPEIRITGAAIDGTGHVVVSLALADHGAPVATREAALALEPRFTLAALSTHPVDGLASWKSHILTGATIPQLPPGGPGTPPENVLTNVKQPGAEADGTLAGADGAFTYVFATALPAGFDPDETLRVGVWLLGNGTAAGTSTHDFRPAGGAPAPRDTVLTANCERCHEVVASPRGAVGVKICLTCHTWQNADPDTVDPAALYGATAATDPNPLDLGRMVHRIHRGKNLPTLYASSSTLPALPLEPPPTPPPATDPQPPPFAKPFLPGRNTAIVGRKFSIVGGMSEENVFAKVVTRTENGATPRNAATGITFPRDYRDCGVCHAGAPQEYEVLFGISRRTCHGCHPETWFEPPKLDGTTSIVEPAPAVHFAHTGGPQAHDGECVGCHVAATATQPKVYAPIADAHVIPRDHRRANKPWFEIVSVSELVPGGAPTVRFKLMDRVGPVSPIAAPTIPSDTAVPPSPVGRGMYSLRIHLAGPTVPDFANQAPPFSSGDTGNPDPLALVADADGVFTYTFASTLPATVSGTWAVALEGRRRATITYYDPATGTFPWPHTGETVTESPDNAIAYVDTSVGTWPGGNPVPRRTVVAQEKCLRCHARFESHGGQRHELEFCVICHTPTRTDWSGRPKWAAGTPLAGNVNLAATYDVIEERSTQLKMFVHRLHTGRRQGSASLELVRPYSSSGTSATFRSEGMFPNDLAKCTLCHEGRTYDPDVVPRDAPPTVANETGTLRHAAGAPPSLLHAVDDPATHAAEAACASTPAITAACLACHATGSARLHVERYPPAGGVETCGPCHASGAVGVDLAHGLARPGATPVAASWSSIVQNVIVPRCASAACHGGNPPTAFPQLDAEVAWAAMVDVPSQQASGMDMIEPFDPGASYLVLKLRGEAASAGGVATPMPIGDAMLDPSDIAAIEAWIANGAPND
jgi:OmcA/MtrC family decaheme c-type cytochrome